LRHPSCGRRGDPNYPRAARNLATDHQSRVTQAGALTPEDLAAVQQQVRARVLRWFARAGHLEQADARDMAGWRHGGGL